MSKLKEEITRILNKEDNRFFLNMARISVSLPALENTRLEYITNHLDISKQGFISDIIEAAIYDIEVELGLRDINVDVLHNDMTFRKPITKDYITTLTAMMADKDSGNYQESHLVSDSESSTKPKRRPIKKPLKTTEEIEFN